MNPNIRKVHDNPHPTLPFQAGAVDQNSALKHLPPETQTSQTNVTIHALAIIVPYETCFWREIRKRQNNAVTGIVVTIGAATKIAMITISCMSIIE